MTSQFSLSQRFIFTQWCSWLANVQSIYEQKWWKTEAAQFSGSIQILSVAEMYLKTNFLISEMCMVSLMVVSLLRTWRRPLSKVFSLITTVKSTPISSNLRCNDRDVHTNVSPNTTDLPIKSISTSITALSNTLLGIQLLHWCWCGLQIPRPRRDLSLQKLLQKALTDLQNNSSVHKQGPLNNFVLILSLLSSTPYLAQEKVNVFYLPVSAPWWAPSRWLEPLWLEPTLDATSAPEIIQEI